MAPRRLIRRFFECSIRRGNQAVPASSPHDRTGSGQAGSPDMKAPALALGTERRGG